MKKILVYILLFVICTNGWGQVPFMMVKNEVQLSGNFVIKDSVLLLGSTFDMVNDDNYLYIASNTQGLRTYTVDENGILTFIDSITELSSYHNVEVHNGIICALGTSSNSMSTYSVNAFGSLTFLDSQNFPSDVDFIHSDGAYVYTAGGFGGSGLRSFSVDGSGNISIIDSIITNNASGLWKLDDYLFFSNGSYIFTVTVDVSGGLTKTDSIAYYADNLWGKDSCLYAAGITTGTQAGGFSVDNSGSISLANTVDNGASNWTYYIYGDDNFVYAGGENGMNTRSYTTNELCEVSLADIYPNDIDYAFITEIYTAFGFVFTYNDDDDYIRVFTME